MLYLYMLICEITINNLSNWTETKSEQTARENQSNGSQKGGHLQLHFLHYLPRGQSQWIMINT